LLNQMRHCLCAAGKTPHLSFFFSLSFCWFARLGFFNSFHFFNQLSLFFGSCITFCLYRHK
jgi:hypothetical protein